MPELEKGFGLLEMIIMLVVLAAFTSLAELSLRQMSQTLARIKQNDDYVFTYYET